MRDIFIVDVRMVHEGGGGGYGDLVGEKSF